MPFPVDEQFIVEAEKELGLSFPFTFRERMRKRNGGEIETVDDTWTIHPFFDKSDKRRIKRTTNNIILETKNSRSWNKFPSRAIAIGENGSGDKLILLPCDTDLRQLGERVYVWLHETGEVMELANSFDELST